MGHEWVTPMDSAQTGARAGTLPLLLLLLVLLLLLLGGRPLLLPLLVGRSGRGSGFERLLALHLCCLLTPLLSW